MTAVLKLYRRYIPSLSVVYLSFPSAKIQIGLIISSKTIDDVFTLIPYETFEEWAGTAWKKEDAYEAKRRNCAAFIKRSLQTITTSRR
jgi:hypothetical protein